MIVTVTLPIMCKTRSLLPLTITLPDPVPMIRISAVMSRSPVDAESSPAPVRESEYVPAGNEITLLPPEAFACMIAARSVQVLLEVWHVTLLVSSSISSAVLFTVKSIAGVAVAAKNGMRAGAGRREACAMFGMSMAMTMIKAMMEMRVFMCAGNCLTAKSDLTISARRAAD